MKNIKRSISVLLLLCMLISMLPSALAASSSMPFTDVRSSDWFYSAVQYVYDNGMMSGTGATTFSPNATTTRGMIVTILHRMEKTPKAAGTTFSDVPANQYYADAVAWASSNNIVSGYGNSKFGPNDPITREQMAAILYRYAQYKKDNVKEAADLSSFSDNGKVSAYAVDAMKWAVGKGLISGVGNNQLSPTGSATRAQVAMILARFCGAMTTSSVINSTKEEINKTDTQYTDFENHAQQIDNFEAQYVNQNGTISTAHQQQLIDTIAEYASSLQSQGDVITFKKDVNSVYIKFRGGIGYIYSLPQKDALSTVSTFTPTGSFINKIGFAMREFESAFALNYADYNYHDVSSCAKLISAVLPNTNAQSFSSSRVTVASASSMSNSDFIIWEGHGAYNSAIHSCLVTDEKASIINYLAYSKLLENDELVISNEKYYCITSKFIKNRINNIDGCLVFLGACHSLQDNVLAQAFLSKGASVVLGYNNLTYIPYEMETRSLFFEFLVNYNATVNECVLAAKTLVGKPGSQGGPGELVTLPTSSGYTLIKESHSSYASLSGAVVDAASQKPLSDVSVYVSEANSDASPVTAKTDYLGNFSLSAEKDRLYTITFSKEGYQSTSKNIVLAKDTSLGTIEMTPNQMPSTQDSISGSVRNKETGVPVSGIQVKYWSEMHPEQNETAVTDMNGCFVFRNKTVSDDWWSLYIDNTAVYTYDFSDNPTAEGYQTFDGFCGQLYVRAKSSSVTSDYRPLYENETLTLTGTIWSEPYNTNTGEEKIAYILTLDTPLYVQYQSASNRGQTEKVYSVQFMPRGNFDIDSIEGEHAQITGTVMMGHTIHHLTTFLLQNATCTITG